MLAFFTERLTGRAIWQAAGMRLPGAVENVF